MFYGEGKNILSRFISVYCEHHDCTGHCYFAVHVVVINVLFKL